MKVTLKLHGCLFCCKQYGKDVLLEDHLRSHLQERPFECPLCEKRFTSYIGRWNHIWRHQALRSYSCSLCNLKFKSNGDRKQHLATHVVEKNYKCSACHRGFRHKKDLKRHESIHQSSPEPLLPRFEQNACLFCYKCFFKREQLNLHLLGHIKERPYDCKICDFSCNTNYFLKAHQQSLHNPKCAKCNLCEEVFKSDFHLAAHRRRIHGMRKKYVCSICQHVSHEQHSFNKHLRIHTGERLYNCEVCTKAFKSRAGLLLHRGIHFPELRKQQQRDCPTCRKTFRSVYSLRYHLQAVHSEVSAHLCKICNKRFKNPCDLRLHTTIHTGERLYKCRVCPKSFRTSATRCGHEKRAHKIGNPEIRCEICRRMLRKVDYTEHMMRHLKIKPHECIFCGKRFIKKRELYLHTQRHIKEVTTQEKSFACLFCGKSYPYVISLQLHLLSHTKESPHFCFKCGAELKGKQNLQNHLRRYH